MQPRPIRSSPGSSQLLQAGGLLGELAPRRTRQRCERLESHAAACERPEPRDEAVDEERRRHLGTLDHRGSVLVRDHASPVVVAQHEIVEARQQARRSSDVSMRSWRSRKVEQLAP